jgi:ABC-type transporter Mla maintaining outer membrane lipid asymmetry ATPase subunit MlaF
MRFSFFFTPINKMPAPKLPENPAIIELNDVAVGSLENPEKAVLEDVNWSVAAGEYWVIGGMQGSGKSDLISLTGGLMSPLRGTYRLFDCEMPIFGEELLAQRLRLGIVFDNGQLLHQLTVQENIALPLRYHQKLAWTEVDERVKAMLDLTGLAPYADSMPGRLEHHLKKRAGLARALMLKPEALLLDEPLGGLDFRHAKWCLDFLDQLSAGHDFFQRRPITLVATTADFRPWHNPACRFAALKDQKFIILGQRKHLAGHTEPLVGELLAKEFQTH